MSSINTNSIDANYPVPGVNNNSQGFRNNFASIKTNLDTAGTEITDLQNKVVVKQALANTTLNNDMANTLISNASIRSFRATTYNLGGALSGTVKINASLGDVQYGTLSANSNITLQFGNWAPDGTQSNVQLILNVADNNSFIRFGGTNVTDSLYTIENYEYDGGNLAISAPNGVSQMSFRLSTTDCGNTITIEPYDRPRQSTQIQQRTPSPTGFDGDMAGDVAVDANYLYVCTATFDSTGANLVTVNDATTTTASNDRVTFTNPHGISDLNVPVIFTGNTFGDIVANTIYYVKTIPSSTTITLSDTRTAGTAGSTFALSDDSGTMSATFYLGSDIWKRIELTYW